MRGDENESGAGSSLAGETGGRAADDPEARDKNTFITGRNQAREIVVRIYIQEAGEVK